MIKKILIITLVFCTQACSSDGYNLDKEFRLSKESSMGINDAILITRAETKSVKHDGKVFDRNFNKMNWCRTEEKKRCKDILYFNPYTKIKFRSDNRSDFNYDFYLVKPGSYYLNDIKQFRGYIEDWYTLPIVVPVGILTFGATLRKTPNFNTSTSGWNRSKNAPNFVSFEINPGEIVYIGDLDFTFTKQKYWFKGKVNLEIQDNYKEAVSYFHSEYPEYKDKPVIKRLAKPGILLDDYSAGTFW
jgi:hypothetical protein